LATLAAQLRTQGFKTEEHSHSLNATTPVSQLRIQFTTDDRYQAFLARSVDAEVLGVRVKIACLGTSRRASSGLTAIRGGV